MCNNDTLVSSYGCFASWLKCMCLRIRITLYVGQKIFGYRIPCVQVTTLFGKGEAIALVTCFPVSRSASGVEG